MKKILSIVFLVIPLLFLTYACGEETQAKVIPGVDQVAPAIKNVVEKTKTAVESVETAAVEAIKGLEREEPVTQPTEATTSESESVAQPTEVITSEEEPAVEPTEVTTSEEEPAVEPVAIAVDLKQGGQLFTQNCAGCHAGGKNLINASKTLKKDALVKYDMYSKDAIVYQITNGKNAMPAFGSRLSSEKIENIAGYVLAQADKGW